jgi:hypothetical protein
MNGWWRVSEGRERLVGRDYWIWIIQNCRGCWSSEEWGLVWTTLCWEVFRSDSRLRILYLISRNSVVDKVIIRYHQRPRLVSIAVVQTSDVSQGIFQDLLRQLNLLHTCWGWLYLTSEADFGRSSLAMKPALRAWPNVLVPSGGEHYHQLLLSLNIL